MKKEKFFLFFVFILVFLLTSCAQPPRLVKLEPQPYTPLFKVKQGKKPEKDLGIKVALLLPKGQIPAFKLETPNQTYPILPMALVSVSKIKQEESDLPESFKRNLIKSMESILLNKGYRVTGPFKSLDEMTYNEKKNVDFVLLPVIELYSELDGPKCNTERPLQVAMGVSVSKGKIHCSGKVKFNGQLSFVVLEPLTREKLYIKGIDFSTEGVPINVLVEYNSQEAYLDAVRTASNALSEAINNALNKALEQTYNKFLELFEKYMPEGEEALALKKQADELKRLKRF